MKLYLRLLLALVVIVTPMIFFTASPASAAVDNCTWSGAGADNLWSTSANWSCSVDGATAPGPGDTLVFPAGAARITNVNDLVAGTVFDNISITGDHYDLSGNAIELDPASTTILSLDGSYNTINIPTTLTATTSRSFYSGGTDNVIADNLILNFTGDLNVTGPVIDSLEFTGPITGTTRFIVLNKTIELKGTNTFSATSGVQVNASASIFCEAQTCLGAASNDVTLTGSSVLYDNTTEDIPNDISLYAGSSSPEIIGMIDGASISGNITLVDTDSFIGTAAGDTLTISGTVDVGANALFYGDNISYGSIIQDGVVSGSGDIVIGTYVYMSNASLFTGDTTISAGGTLSADQAGSMGTSAGDVTIDDGGRIVFEGLGGNITVDKDITVVGNGTGTGAIILSDVTDDATIIGDITLTGNTTFSNGLAGTSELDFSGSITGTGDIIVTSVGGTGGIGFGGATPNDYVGNTYVTGGDLFVGKTSGIAIPGNLTVKATSTTSAFFLVAVPGNNQIADNAIVNLITDPAHGALFASNDPDEVIGSLIGDGLLYADSSAQGFTVGGGNLSGAFSGSFVNTAPTAITKIGTGTWDLTGAAYSGTAGQGPTIAVSGGDVNVGGALLSEIDTVIGTGATLKGTGAIGDTTVNAGGNLSTGNSPGCLQANSLALNSGSNFNVEIGGASACSGYDQTNVIGTTNLGNATLNVSRYNSYAPEESSQFTIVASTGALSGTFNGLADGATFSSDGYVYRINYSTNAATLTAVSIPPVSIPALPTTGVSFASILVMITLMLSAGGTILLILAKRRRFQFIK